LFKKCFQNVTTTSKLLKSLFSYRQYRVGHIKNSTFFPNMDINIVIREDVRKNAFVKKSGSFVKYSQFLFLRKKIVFTRDYIYVPRLTYRSKHYLPILLLNKDLFGVIFLIFEISGIFLSFSQFFEHECTEHVNTTLCEKGIFGQTLF